MIYFIKNHDDIAQEIATNGFNMIWNNLKMKDVICYWRKLLKKYAKLLDFDVVLDERLIEIHNWFEPVYVFFLLIRDIAIYFFAYLHYAINITKKKIKSPAKSQITSVQVVFAVGYNVAWSLLFVKFLRRWLANTLWRLKMPIKFEFDF